MRIGMALLAVAATVILASSEPVKNVVLEYFFSNQQAGSIPLVFVDASDSTVGVSGYQRDYLVDQHEVTIIFDDQPPPNGCGFGLLAKGGITTPMAEILEVFGSGTNGLWINLCCFHLYPHISIYTGYTPSWAVFTVIHGNLLEITAMPSGKTQTFPLRGESGSLLFNEKDCKGLTHFEIRGVEAYIVELRLVLVEE
jgi:hypothetical protein